MILRLLLFLMMITSVSPMTARADDGMDYFSRLPIQHEGRIKPVDSFSKSMLILFSGKGTAGKMNSNEWLAHTIFDPARALSQPVFKTYKPESAGLPRKETPYYSFMELAPAMAAKKDIVAALAAKEPQSWSADQAELMRLHECLILYTQLLRSFSYFLPLPVEVPDALRKEWKIKEGRTITLKDYLPHARDLERRVAQILRRKGEDTTRYTEQEKEIVLFAYHMDLLREGAAGTILLRVIPDQGTKGGEWVSPWEVVEGGAGTPATTPYMNTWKQMAIAFNAGNDAGFEEAASRAHELSRSFYTPSDISLEIAYNTLQPFDLSLILFAVSAGFFILYRRHEKIWMKKSVLVLACLGTMLAAAGLAMRVILLDRPPVGTLYESVLFVAALCGTLGLFITARKKELNGAVGGAVAAAFLLFVARSFEGHETLGVLPAVLNTNFWLATHVLCITAGYAACIITSVLAHISLWQARDETNEMQPLKYTHGMALVSLLLTATGTILGGIWADQSWGRFWGWDPKENGALLIVLWIAWLLHGRMAGQINEILYLAGLAALSVIVALAWFGVNLLNIGLHSYGFISGVAIGLAAFCATQSAVIAFLMIRQRKR